MSAAKAILVATLSIVVSARHTFAQQEAPSQSDLQRLQAHAKYFSRLDFDQPYFQRHAAPDGTVDLSVEMLNDYAAALEGSIISPQDQLKQLLNAFSAVMVATAKRQTSALTPRQSFLYSDWTFEVTDVVKNTSTLPIAEHQQVTVARSGGFLTVNNRKLVAHDRNFPDFQPGHSYLLFLKPLPESNSFLAQASGSFDLTGPHVVYLDDPQRQTDLRAYVQAQTPSSIVTEAHSLQQSP